MTRSLLIEIGTEELPASWVKRALEVLPELVTGALDAARLAHGEARAYGTPRRLAVLVDGVADRTPDLEEEVLGPPKSAAFEADGTPKKAAEGFAKKNNAALADVFVKKTDKGEYAAVVRKEKGRDAKAVVSEMASALPPRIPFAKSMRWGAGELSFGRPIHWIVALFGDEIVEGGWGGVRFGRTTRGHRFLAPDPVQIPTASAYLSVLRDAHVLADEDQRRKAMVAALEARAKKIGAVVEPDDFLVDENASLVEEPFVVLGSFDERFLQLPDEVIVAVMRGHQRYFALRTPDGTLLPKYFAIANTAIDEAQVARGNDRVLVARLKDAEFFVGEDRKKKLEERLPKLGGIVFQAKLGTVGEKVARVGDLAVAIGGGAKAKSTAALAKADLVSLIVGEFPELQGLMGRWYALREGLDADVADAIRDHYLPKGAGDAIPPSKLSAAIALADRADTLVGCFGIGIVPTGSQDPFALRRATLGILRIALEGPLAVSLETLFASAHAGLSGQKKPVAAWDVVLPRLDDFVRARLRVMLGEKHPADVVEACLAPWKLDSVRELAHRVAALDAFRAHPSYESLTVAFKRAWNIAKDVAPAEPDAALLEAGAERDLWTAFSGLREDMQARVANGDYAGALNLVGTDLRAPIDRFFTEVFVMVDDARVRENRLRMLRTIAGTINAVAHLHLLGG
ncbi:MAG: glycine--tRNA ligase subunit beta [Sandaracinus sp.]